MLVDVDFEGGKRSAGFVETDPGGNVAGQVQGPADIHDHLQVVEGPVQVAPSFQVGSKVNPVVFDIHLEGGCIGRLGSSFFKQFFCNFNLVHGLLFLMVNAYLCINQSMFDCLTLQRYNKLLNPQIFIEKNTPIYCVMMSNEEKTAYVKRIYGLAVAKGLCNSMTEFAKMVGSSQSTLSAGLGTRPENLSPKLMERIALFASANGLDRPERTEQDQTESVLVIPYGARGGTIGDFVDGVHDYDCEKVLSPVKGADYAMEVTGDSMSPDFPSGSRILIKKIDETAFIAWNEVYVLDTPNGAVIKRIRRTEDPAVIECVSINPAYQPYRIERDFIRGWYRVLMVMSLK